MRLDEAESETDRQSFRLGNNFNFRPLEWKWLVACETYLVQSSRKQTSRLVSGVQIRTYVKVVVETQT